jgi:hypothetical protein
MTCSHCTHPMYAGIRCGDCGRWTDEKEEDMNRDDIIRMARKAGMEMDTSGIGWTTADDPNFLYPECVYTENLERFAALVAAAERDAVWNIVFDYAGREDLSDSDQSLLKHLSDLIRARGDK